MKIGIVRERRPNENRVAATPDTIKKFVGLGLEVHVESGAGIGASITDAGFANAGATVENGPEKVLGQADIVLKVQKPIGPGAPVKGEADEVAMMKDGATLACLMEPYRDRALFEALAARNISCSRWNWFLGSAAPSPWTCCPRSRTSRDTRQLSRPARRSAGPFR